MADRDKDKAPAQDDAQLQDAAPPPPVMTPADALQERQRQAARAMGAGGRARDETIPGGRYVNEAGDLVDAEGKPLKKGG